MRGTPGHAVYAGSAGHRRSRHPAREPGDSHRGRARDPPDYLDTQEILTRRGSTLKSSNYARWASRLSLGATDLITARLAQSRPDALVTDQPETDAFSDRLLINVSRLDVAADVGSKAGLAVLEADWMIVPRDTAIATLRGRVRLEAAGPIGTVQDVVALERSVLSQLAGAIDITLLR